MFYVLDFKTHRFISCSNANEVFAHIQGLMKEGVHQSDLEIINGFGEEVRFDVNQFSSYCKTLSLTERFDPDAFGPAAKKKGELQNRAPVKIEVGMAGTIKNIPGIKKSLHGKTFVVTEVKESGYITGTIEGKPGFYGVLRDDLENLFHPAADKDHIFQNKPIAKWSFTGMYEEYETALRELLASGKSFDTGWGYSTDVSAYLRITAEGNALEIDVRKEIEPDSFEAYIENATEGDWAKVRLTEEVMSELIDYLEEHPEYTKYVSHYSMHRDEDFEEISDVIDMLEDSADAALKNSKNGFKRVVHEVLLANIPDEDAPEIDPPDIAALKGEISNLRHELNGLMGNEGEEELVPALNKTLFRRECELFAAENGITLDEGHLEQTDGIFEDTTEDKSVLYIDEVVRAVVNSNREEVNHIPSEELILNIKKQLTDKESETSYGEPQAWVELSNGRSIEVTLEQEGLGEKDFFFSVRLHCNEAEYNNEMFHGTMGVIDQYNTAGGEIDEIDKLIRQALECNEKYPVEKCSTQENVHDNIKKEPSLDDRIRSAGVRVGEGRPETDAKEEGIKNGSKGSIIK